MKLAIPNVSSMKHAFPIMLFALGAACGGEEDDASSGGSAGTGGSNASGSGGTAGSAGNDTAGGDGGTSGEGGSGGSSGAAGKAGGGGTSGSAPEGGVGGGGDEPLVGVCGLRSAGTVTTDDFETYEEFYLLGDEGFGEDVCVVRVDVVRVGEAPAGCDEMAGQQDECLWTHLVEYRNPEVVLDEGGACANSDLGMDAAAVAALEGTQIAYGYVFEYQGHNSVLMTYDEATSRWEPGVNAGWTEETGAFQFDRADGFCNYR